MREAMHHSALEAIICCQTFLLCCVYGYGRCMLSGIQSDYVFNSAIWHITNISVCQDDLQHRNLVEARDNS